MQNNTLKLEVGKKYRDRVGRVVRITHIRSNHSYTGFVYRTNSDGWARSFREDGRYFPEKESNNDLIEEVVDRPALILEAGKKYRTRGGDVVTLSAHDSPTDSAYRFIGDNGYYYTTDGTLFLGGVVRVEDLDEEVVDRPQPGETWITESGILVRIIANDIPGDQPVAGYPLDHEYEDHESRVWTWSAAGRMLLDGSKCEDDLDRKLDRVPDAWQVLDAAGGNVVVAPSLRYAKSRATHLGDTIRPLFAASTEGGAR